MHDHMTSEETEQTKQYLRFAGRFVRKYLTLLLFSIYVFLMPTVLTKDPFLGFTVNKGYVITGTVIALFMFYSVQRLVTVYNAGSANLFLDNGSPITTFKEKIKHILSQKENRLELLIFALLFILLPVKLTVPCLEWLFLNGNEAFIPKALFTLGVLALLLVIYFMAYFSAMTYWDAKERARRDDLKNFSEEERKRYAKAEKKTFKNMFSGIIVGYFLGSIGLMFLLPAIFMAFSPLLILLIEPAVYIPLSLIIIIPPIFRRVRAYRKRKKFFAVLTELCRKKRYILSKIKNPYKSIFGPCEGETFNVRIGEKKYSCKIISSLKRNRDLYIMKNGIGGWFIRWKFISIELFSYTKTFEFGWESDAKKVLIVNPVPKRVLTPKGEHAIPEENTEYYVSQRMGGLKAMVLKTTSQEYATELDNCDIVGGYEFYTATGFLNALERDIIDKDL